MGASRGSGRTAWHSPAWAIAPGMPQTTLVASSCATAAPPACTTARVPARPSWPMPVSIATSTRPSQAVRRCAASDRPRGGRNSPAESRTAHAHRAPRAFDQQMAVARRQIDPPGLQRLAVLRLGAGHAAKPVQVFGQDRREGRGHVLGQHHRHAYRPAQPLDQREQRLRPAGGAAHRQQACRECRDRTQGEAWTGSGGGGAPARCRSRARPFTFSNSFRRELLEKVKGLARLRHRAGAPPPAGASPRLALRPVPALAARLLAVGSSTGGPQALFTLVQGLGRR